MTAPDPMDQPEDDEPEYELVYPFVACASQGGPYDDDAFVAGVQLGRIDQALQVAAALGTNQLGPVTIRTSLVRQVELAGMARGFPVLTKDDTYESWEAGPEWVTVTFAMTEATP